MKKTMKKVNMLNLFIRKQKKRMKKVSKKVNNLKCFNVVKIQIDKVVVKIQIHKIIKNNIIIIEEVQNMFNKPLIILIMIMIIMIMII